MARSCVWPRFTGVKKGQNVLTVTEAPSRFWQPDRVAGEAMGASHEEDFCGSGRCIHIHHCDAGRHCHGGHSIGSTRPRFVDATGRNHPRNRFFSLNRPQLADTYRLALMHRRGRRGKRRAVAEIAVPVTLNQASKIKKMNDRQSREQGPRLRRRHASQRQTDEADCGSANVVVDRGSRPTLISAFQPAWQAAANRTATKTKLSIRPAHKCVGGADRQLKWPRLLD